MTIRPFLCNAHHQAIFNFILPIRVTVALTRGTKNFVGTQTQCILKLYSIQKYYQQKSVHPTKSITKNQRKPFM